MTTTTKAPVTWDELQAEIRELRDRVDHLTAMRDEDLQAGQAIEDRVARCEARLDGRGDEVAGETVTIAWTDENNPPEALTEDDALKPDSPEDTEGLEVVGYWADFGTPEEPEQYTYSLGELAPIGSEEVVRLSDAVDKIRGMRETFNLLWDRHDRLTARLESVERERDEAKERATWRHAKFLRKRIQELRIIADERLECMTRQEKRIKRMRQPIQSKVADNWLGVVNKLDDKVEALEQERAALRQRLEGMVVTPEMLPIISKWQGEIVLLDTDDREELAEHVNRALRGEGGGDE